MAFVKDRLAGRRADGQAGRRAAKAGPAHPPTRLPAPTYSMPDAPDALRLRSTFTREGYQQGVARVIEYIFAGDIFQANLSQRFEAPLVGTPLELYRRLRSRNPAPFSAFPITSPASWAWAARSCSSAAR